MFLFYKTKGDFCGPLSGYYYFFCVLFKSFHMAQSYKFEFPLPFFKQRFYFESYVLL